MSRGKTYYQGNGMCVMTNPFAGKTKVNIFAVKDEVVNMELVDVSGKTYIGYNARLSAGNNLFEISLTTPQMYILSLRTSEGMHSVKLLNTGRADVNRISPMFEGDCAKVWWQVVEPTIPVVVRYCCQR